jgi:hypothetical protein
VDDLPPTALFVWDRRWHRRLYAPRGHGSPAGEPAQAAEPAQPGRAIGACRDFQGARVGLRTICQLRRRRAPHPDLNGKSDGLKIMSYKVLPFHVNSLPEAVPGPSFLISV